ATERSIEEGIVRLLGWDGLWREVDAAYLVGIDDNGHWAVEVPISQDTVSTALAWLHGEEVTQALSDGLRVLRQGPVYAVEHDEDWTKATGHDLRHRRWDPEARILYHEPETGTPHEPLHVPFLARFVRQQRMPVEDRD
ncbi:hypothetical protein LCGC14_3145090, partial [marine sediment metagenome]